MFTYWLGGGAADVLLRTEDREGDDSDRKRGVESGLEAK